MLDDWNSYNNFRTKQINFFATNMGFYKIKAETLNQKLLIVSILFLQI